MSYSYNPLFKGPIANAAIQYVVVPIHNEITQGGQIGISIIWPDAVSAATFALEYSDLDPSEAPYDVLGDASKWIPSGVAIAAVVAGAVGAKVVDVPFVPHKRARLKITATANSNFDIRDGLA